MHALDMSCFEHGWASEDLQARFLAAAFGGPNEYKVRDLHEQHAGCRRMLLCRNAAGLTVLGHVRRAGTWLMHTSVFQYVSIVLLQGNRELRMISISFPRMLGLSPPQDCSLANPHLLLGMGPSAIEFCERHMGITGYRFQLCRL